MNEKRPITHLTNLIAEAARVYGVIPDIHPDDFVFQHSLSRNPNATVVAKRYFDRGDYAARKLSEYIARFSFGGRLAASVLDFASGYGCVARHFHRYREKSVRVVCCDIHDAAVAFMREKLQIEAVRPQTMVSRSFRQAMRFSTSLQIVDWSIFSEAEWEGYQDVYILTRAPGARLCPALPRSFGGGLFFCIQARYRYSFR
jgi:SAM-dependent methyltransferase